MKRVKDMTGARFGRLTVVSLSSRSGARLSAAGKKYTSIIWVCKCSCGAVREVDACNLRSGHTISCGCHSWEQIRTINQTHGGSRTRLYRIWCNIIRRCEVSCHKEYAHYGGRGIRMCPEWRNDFAVFRAWALANGYADTLTIDRIDNDGNYEPGNCQWLTLSENISKKWAKASA